MADKTTIEAKQEWDKETLPVPSDQQVSSTEFNELNDKYNATTEEVNQNNAHRGAPHAPSDAPSGTQYQSDQTALQQADSDNAEAITAEAQARATADSDEVTNRNSAISQAVDNLEAMLRGVGADTETLKALRDDISTLSGILSADDPDLDTAQERIDRIKQLISDVDTLAIVDVAGLQAALDAINQQIIARIPQTKQVLTFAEAQSDDHSGYEIVKTSWHHSMLYGGGASYRHDGTSGEPNTGDELKWFDSTGRGFKLFCESGEVSVDQTGAEPGNSNFDSGAAIQRALDSEYNVLSPGVYHTSVVHSYQYKTLSGLSLQKSKIVFTGSLTDFCLSTFGGQGDAGLQNITIESEDPGNKGVRCEGAAFTSYKSVNITGFTDVGFKLGDIPLFRGSYWGTFDNVRVHNSAGVICNTGIYIEGGGTPSTNSNVFLNVVVSGSFQTPLHIKGNSNKFIGGTIELSANDENTDQMILIEGNGNVVEDMYVEPYGDIDKMPHLVEYLAGSTANDVRIYPAFSYAHNIDRHIIDNGDLNKTSIRRRSANMPILVRKNSGNLIHNSGFNAWRDANHPVGWIFGTTRVTKDDADTHGGDTSLLMSESNSNSTIQYYLTDYFSAQAQNTPYTRDILDNENVIVGVYCKTDVAGAGGIRCNGQGSASHTGSGEWELLTVSQKLLESAARHHIELRSHPLNAAITGEVRFSKPFVRLGTEMSEPGHSYIRDSGAKMYGDLEMAGGPDALLCLQGTYLWADSSGQLRTATTRPTQLDSEGAPV